MLIFAAFVACCFNQPYIGAVCIALHAFLSD